jgi:DNA adenine methylase
MPVTPSPLRYPGGKTSIWKMVAQIIKDNKLERCHYIEPYAGGCGLALSLLYNGVVHELHLNDIDRSISCFWFTILNRSEEFISLIRETPVTMDEWYRQREIQENKDFVSDFELAFSSFFLNRTNRSGVILKAGVIGGLGQRGNYRLDCRYNKDGLIEKIQRIAKYRHRIHFHNLDALDFIETIDKTIPKSKSFFCIDPPYFKKGSTLYTNFYEPNDHGRIARRIQRLKHSWVITYDNAPEIRNLYQQRQQYVFNLNYSAQEKRVGTELLIASDNVIVSPRLHVAPVGSGITPAVQTAKKRPSQRALTYSEEKEKFRSAAQFA